MDAGRVGGGTACHPLAVEYECRFNGIPRATEISEMRIQVPWIAVGLAFVLGVATASQAHSTTPVLRVPKQAVPLNRPLQNQGAVANTRFDPRQHGFHFSNGFANNMIPEFDIRTDGLCGGMAFAAMDYFNSSVPVPTQDYQPGEGSELRKYLYARQTNSIVDHNHVKWVELGVNPGGARNAEFYRWGLEGPNGRLDELKRRIQRGEPVTLGLKGCDEGCSGDHQVVAIGYDVGNFTGDLSQDHRQVKIFLYDPNFPDRKMTLTADPDRKQFYLAESPNSRWRTWFISDYSKRTPPRITQPTRELVLELRTGGDDLRGGNDNVHVVVLSKDGREFRHDNANLRRRWINNSTNAVSIALPDWLGYDNLRGVRLETTFGGGIGGDNWNLDEIMVRYRDGSRDDYMIHPLTGRPLVRFTGNHKQQEFLF